MDWIHVNGWMDVTYLTTDRGRFDAEMVAGL